MIIGYSNYYILDHDSASSSLADRRNILVVETDKILHVHSAKYGVNSISVLPHSINRLLQQLVD